MLPAPVLRQAADELTDWHGTGMSVMEMSHRGKDFIGIAQDAEARLRALMEIPDNYQVLFLQGGATGQFVGVVANLSTATGVADYVITGQWGQKAYAEASKYLDRINVAARTDPHTYVPPQDEWSLSKNAGYVHITLNETVNGVVFDKIPDTGDVPLVADVSSIILSEPIDVTKFGAIYAGAQKNIGPAGLTVVIVRDDLLARTRPRMPQIWDWYAMAKAGSMLNTPPTYAWYIAGLVFAWLQEQGGRRGHREGQPAQSGQALRRYRRVRPVRQPGRAGQPVQDERAIHRGRARTRARVPRRGRESAGMVNLAGTAA